MCNFQPVYVNFIQENELNISLKVLPTTTLVEQTG